MKKFIAIFPIIVVLIMSNMVGMYAHGAEAVSESVYVGRYIDSVEFWELGIGFDDYLDNYEYDENNGCIYFNTRYYNSSKSVYRYQSFFFNVDRTNVNTTLVDNVYTITFDDASNYYYSQYYFQFDSNNLITGTANTPSLFLQSNSNYDTVQIDLNTNTVTISGGNGSTTSYTAYEVECTYDDSPFVELDLTVSFTPALSGEVDRIIEQNGVQAESDYFSMTITNNSSENAQFLMAIVPTGSSSNFVNNTADSVGVEFFPDKQIFTLMYKEWQYAPTITGTTASVGKAVEREYNQTSGWHIVSGNSTYTRQFNWKQINLQADTSYDVVVVAIPTEFSKPSIVFTHSDCEHYLDSSKGEEVYRSTFTVLNPAVYDSTCTDFGNVVGSTMVGESQKAEAYVDDNGEVVVEDISASDKLADRGTWEPGIIENSVELFSLEGVQALFDSCGNVINFIGYSFVFMPSWYWIILLFGITAVVAIGIIKALKG